MQIKAKKGLLAVLLSATTLTSCASLQNKKIKVSEIRDALSYEEGLTNLDEQVTYSHHL